jgi:NADPH:quinone reductase-like Zn-dependent oxidoreductase
MKAVGYRSAGGVEVLTDIEIPRPAAGPRDLLVAVRAVSVNPVDAKRRQREAPPTSSDYRVLGYDAAGVVEAVGSQVSLFKTGDEVFYAGATDRPGSNSEYQLVDERIVGPKPKSLSFADAAAMPLTVIATASRPETADWVRKLGAARVADHRIPINQAIKEIGFDSVDYIAAITTTPGSASSLAAAMSPQGHITLIDNFDESIMPFKSKSVTISWEMMFTRSLFQTEDMSAQHRLLAEVSSLADRGVLRSTRTQSMGSINARNLKQAHSAIESGRTIGKIVLEGF